MYSIIQMFHHAWHKQKNETADQHTKWAASTNSRHTRKEIPTLPPPHWNREEKKLHNVSILPVEKQQNWGLRAREKHHYRNLKPTSVSNTWAGTTHLRSTKQTHRGCYDVSTEHHCRTLVNETECFSLKLIRIPPFLWKKSRESKIFLKIRKKQNI